MASHQECATVAFCTDSLSLLQAIDNLNPTTTQIRKRMEELSSFLNLMYVPGHKDVPGNELADKWAKDAANLPGPCLDNAVKIGEAKSIAKRLFKDPPSSHPTISKTYEGISQARDKSQVSSRKDSALLAQLRSGHHLSLGYYRNMLDETQSSSCSRCGSTSPDTVSHWLTECAATLAFRMEIFGSTDQRLQDMALARQSSSACQEDPLH